MLDKLGVKDGQAIAIEDSAGVLPPDLVAGIRARASGEPGEEEPLDLAVIAVDAASDIRSLLRVYRARLKPAGGIWLVTPKRGRPGYMRGEDLIPLGLAERLVDNKVCSVSDTLSGMRFVIRRSDRPRGIRTIPS